MNFIELFQQYFPSFSTALGLTLQLALASLICASIIGIIFGMFSVSKNKILNIICKIYVDIIRGTPLVVQVFIMYYGVAGAFLQPMDLNWDDFGGPFMAAVVALSLNAGAYMAEIVRGGDRVCGQGPDGGGKKPRTALRKGHVKGHSSAGDQDNASFYH